MTKLVKLSKSRMNGTRTTRLVGHTTQAKQNVLAKVLALVVGLGVAGMSESTHAQTLTWDANNTGAAQTDGAGAWLGANQWWNGTSNVTWSSGSDAVFGNGGAGGAVTLASPTTVNSLTFNSFTGTYTLGTAGQAITLNTGITKNAGSGNVTINSPITLAGNALINNASTTNMNLTSFSGGFSLTKTGGYVSITGASTYTGTTTIEDGTLNIANATSLGTSTTPIALGNAASISGNLSPYLEVNGAGTNFTRNITVGFDNSPTTGTYMFGTDNSNSSATINGTVTLNQSVTVRSRTNGVFSLAGNLTSGSAGNQTVTFNNTNTGTTVTQVISSVIGGGTGTIDLVKIGTGLTALTAANTYTGTTTINAGVLLIGNGGTTGSLLGTSAIVNNATLTFNRSNAVVQGIDFGTIAGAGLLNKNGTGSLTLNVANAYDGNISINEGSLIVTNNTALGTTLGNTNIAGGGSLQLQGSINISENLVTTGQGTGATADNSSQITAIAPGAIRSVSGNNILSGTLSLTRGSGGTVIRVDAGSSLDIQGSIVNINTARSLYLGGAGVGLVSGKIENGENIGTIPASATVLNVEKIDAGTWTLSNAANTYTGTTTVSAGTLLIQGHLTGTGNFNVNTGTLGGTGGIAGILNVGNGTGSTDAILSPGVAGIGTLSTTNNINFLSDSVFALQINSDGIPSTDLLTTSGAISLGSGLATLNYSDLGSTVLSSGSFSFLSGSSITGTFAGLPDGTVFSVGSNQFAINYTPTSVALTVVPIPEPGSLALLFGGLGAIVGLRRFRRRTA